MTRDEINRLMAETMNRNFQMGSIHDYKGHELPKTLQKSLDYHKSWDSLIPVVAVVNTKFQELLVATGGITEFPKSYKLGLGRKMSTAILENDKKTTFELAGELLEWFKNNPEETWK